MVVFYCGSCGEALKKNQVEKHIGSICRRTQSLSCIDCGKDFDRVAYQEHTKCVTEQEKYGGANYNAPSNMNKGEKKQNQWFEIVQSAINLNTGTTPAKALLKKLQNYPNTPRKRAKFINFVGNSVKGFQPRVVEEVWSILENLIPKGGNENNGTNQTAMEKQQEAKSENSNVPHTQNGNGVLKRSLDSDSEDPKKKLKADENDEKVDDESSETKNPSCRFEWYDELKRAFSKAEDQTMNFETLKKKICKRYKKIKPDRADDLDPVLKKLEKKLKRAPFIKEIESNVYRLTE